MARQRGTASTVFLILLAMLLLVLALSGNASAFLKQLLEWLTGGKWGPGERKGKGDGNGTGGGGTTVPEPSPSPAPGYQWSPAPTESQVPYGPPPPAPAPVKEPNSKVPQKQGPPPPAYDPWPAVIGIISTIIAGFVPVVGGSPA